MSAVASVEKDLDAIRKRDAALADSALAAVALQMAYELDSIENKGHAKSVCAKELRETLDRLRDLAPKERKKDSIDELAKQRARRRGAAASNM